MKKVYLLILCGFFAISAVGCGTVKGLGEDISSVGGWFSKSSNKVKEGN